MTPGRRAAALGGLSLLLGGIAAADMQAREADLARQVGPAVGVLVTRDTVPAGALLTASRLALRHVPQRYAPRTAFRTLVEVSGARAGVRIPRGTDLEPALLAQPGAGPQTVASTLRMGERVARIVVVGDVAELRAGARVDILVTADRPTRTDRPAFGDRSTPTILELREVLVRGDEGLRQRAHCLLASLELRGMPGHACQISVALEILRVKLIDNAVVALIGRQEGGDNLGSRFATGHCRQVRGQSRSVGAASQDVAIQALDEFRVADVQCRVFGRLHEAGRQVAGLDRGNQMSYRFPTLEESY